MSDNTNSQRDLLARQLSRRSFLGAAGGGALALALAACGGDDEEATAPPPAEPAAAPPSPTQEPATKPPELIVRTWSESDYIKAVAASFTAETGIPVKLDTTDEGPSHAKVVQAIRAGERPPVDMSAQLQTRGFLNAVQGLSIPLNPEVVPNLATVSQLAAKPPELPSDNGWPYVNNKSITVPLIYRTDLVDGKAITSWKDLWSDDYRDSIFIDGQYAGSVFAFAKAWGIDPAENAPASLDPLWEKIRELKPNITGFGGGGDVTRGLISGQFSLAVYVPSVALEAQEAGAPVEMTAPKEGVLLLGDAMYVHKNIPDESAYYAQVFINHALAPENQAVAAKDGAVPVHPDTELPAVMTERPEIYPITQEDIEKYAIVAPVPLMARHQDAWQAAFEEAAK